MRSNCEDKGAPLSDRTDSARSENDKTPEILRGQLATRGGNPTAGRSYLLTRRAFSPGSLDYVQPLRYPSWAPFTTRRYSHDFPHKISEENKSALSVNRHNPFSLESTKKTVRFTRLMPSSQNSTTKNQLDAKKRLNLREEVPKSGCVMEAYIK
jgi:hypothetical protein